MYVQCEEDIPWQCEEATMAIYMMQAYNVMGRSNST